MSELSLSVLIPTLSGREGELFQTVAGYRATVPDAEILTVSDLSWGAGLNLLAARSSGDLLLLAPDDAVPSPGWFEAAYGFLTRGIAPGARYLRPDGSGEVDKDEFPDGTPCTWTRLFLLQRSLFERLGPMIDTTWWADIEYSERIVDSGIPMQTCWGFSFSHIDGDRSWNTEVEERRQRELYEVRRAQKLGAVRA